MPSLPKYMTISSTPSRQPAARKARWFAAIAVTGPLLFAGCQTLDVANQNSPSIEGVFSDAVNIESALIGGWRDYWGTTRGSRANAESPVIQLSMLGNELTSATGFFLEVAQEPRIAIDNLDAGGWANRKPWYDMYQVIATGRDVIVSIDANNLRLGNVTSEFPQGTDTERAKIFARFLIGIGNTYLGLLFDQGFPADETDDPEAYDYTFLRPYDELLEKGRESLRSAITQAKSVPDFTLPATWINGNELTRDELVQVMYTYLIRSYVYEARTPEQRAAVNWQQVLGLLDSAIVESQFQQADNTIDDTRSVYHQYAYFVTSGRTNNRLIGPADTSGAYQAWLQTPLDARDAFRLETPDKRISNSTSNTQPAGTRFRRIASQTMSTANGSYVRSFYHSFRYQTPPSNLFHSTGAIPWLLKDELKFIRAEALYRLNRRAEVLPLLNETRVAAGLAPVTVDGPPNNASCVPRKDDGSCGDLFDALMYEKRIDLFPYDPAVTFFDQRGWGKLISGTPLHFPVHGRELDGLGLPIYTIGGGGEGSAP